MAFNISYNIIAVDKFSKVFKSLGASATLTQKKLASLNNNLSLLQKTMAKSNQTTDMMRNRVMQLGAALVGATGIKSIITFGHAMSRIQAIAQITSEQLIPLRNRALELGESTIYSATEVAQGMESLIRAGFSTDETMKSIAATLDLAASGSMDLGEASSITANILRSFNKDASEAGNVADILAAASTRANLNVSDIGLAMSKVGAIGKNMGFSLQEVVASISRLADSGMEASVAGTGLKSMLARLAAPSKQAAKELAQYGIALSDINPQTHSLVQIVDKLANSKLMSSTAGKNAIFSIFGTEAAPTILSLISQLPRLKELATELNNVDGIASKMAQTMGDNLWGDLKKLVSVFERLVLGLGDAGLEGLMRRSIQTITNFIQENGTLIKSILQLSATIVAGIAIVKGIALAVAAWTAAGEILAGTIAVINLLLIANPIGMFLAAVAGGIALLYGFSDSVKNLINTMLSFVLPDWLSSLIGLAGTSTNLNLNTSGLNLNSSGLNQSKANQSTFNGVLDITGAPTGSRLQTKMSSAPGFNLGVNMAGGY